MEEIKFIIESQDVLKEEMASIFGGSADAPPVIHCNSNGIVNIPPTKENQQSML